MWLTAARLDSSFLVYQSLCGFAILDLLGVSPICFNNHAIWRHAPREKQYKSDRTLIYVQKRVALIV